MALDYSKMSDADLAALDKGAYGKMSDAGLALVAAGEGPAAPSRQPATAQTGAGVGMGTPPAPAAVRTGPSALEQTRKMYEAEANNAPEGLLQNRLATIGGALTGMKHGVQSLASDATGGWVPPPNPEDVEIQKAKAREDIVGDVAGNLLPMAVPLGWGGAGANALKGIRGATGFLPKAAAAARAVVPEIEGSTQVLSKALGGGRLAKYGAIPANAALQAGALSAPTEDESRGGNMAKAAAVGLGLQQAGRSVADLVTGTLKDKLTKAGQTLVDQGITPSPAGGSQGFTGKTYGAMQQFYELFSGGKSSRVSDQAMEKVVKEIAPYPDEVGRLVTAHPERSTSFMDGIADQFDRKHYELLGHKDVPIDDAFVTKLASKAQNYLGRGLNPRDKGHIGSVTSIINRLWTTAQDNLQDQVSKNPLTKSGSSAELYKEYRNLLAAQERSLDAAKLGDMHVKEALAATIKSLDDTATKALGKGTMKKLDDLSSKYEGFKTIEASIVNPNVGGIGPGVGELTQAVESRANTGDKARGAERFQDITDYAKDYAKEESRVGTVPRRLGYLAAAVATGVAAPATIIPALIGAGALGKMAKSEAGAKALFGLHPTQQKIAEMLRNREGTIQNLGARLGAMTQER